MSEYFDDVFTDTDSIGTCHDISIDESYGHREGDRGNSELMRYIEEGDVDAVELLIEADPSIIDKHDRLGQTALILAAILGDFDLVKLLVENGANLEETDLTGKTALLHAIESEAYDIVNYLVRGGSDVNVVDHLGQSALFLLAATPTSLSRDVVMDIVHKLIRAGYCIKKDESWISEEALVRPKKDSAFGKFFKKIETVLAFPCIGVVRNKNTENIVSVLGNETKR